MKSLPETYFEVTDQHLDLQYLHGFLREHLDRIRELQLSVALPESVLALDRLPNIVEYFDDGVFWQLADESLDNARWQATVDAQAAANEMSATLGYAKFDLANFELDDPDALAIQKQIERAEQVVIDACVEENDRLIAYRNGLLHVLRATGHAGEAAEAEDLWKHDPGNERRLSALEARISSEEFATVTAAFVRECKDDLQLLRKLTDRSGPTRSNEFLLDHGVKRTRSISTLTLAVDGTSNDLRLPIDMACVGPWEISHPCGCPDSTLGFSREPQLNWHHIDRLFDRYYNLEALRTIDSLLTSTGVFKPDTGPYTFLTDAGFRNSSAPIYAVPQVRLNYYRCDRCGQEFLCRFAEGHPQEPSREFPTGLPGKLLVLEAVQFRGPADGSFLGYLDDRRNDPT